MVSGISFRAGCTDSAKDILNQPQTHARPQAAAQAPEAAAPKKKGNKFLKVVAGLVAAAVVVAGGLAAGKHFGAFNEFIEKVGADAAGAKGFAKSAAEWCNGAGETIIGWGKTAWKAVKNILPKKAEAVAE